jgi:hypothetical protein
MSDVPSRAARRERLQQILAADGSWQATYKAQPASFEGQSPVVTIHNGPVDWAPLTGQRRLQQVTMTLLVTNYVKRGDAEDAEDVLDALLARLVALVNANRQVPDAWNDLRVRGPTAPDYYLVDGEQYRAEVVEVEATSYHEKA